MILGNPKLHQKAVGTNQWIQQSSRIQSQHTILFLYANGEISKKEIIEEFHLKQQKKD